MPAQIVSNQPIPLQTRIGQLCIPIDATTEQAMHEDDGRPVGGAVLLHRQAHAIGCGDGIAACGSNGAQAGGRHYRAHQQQAGQQAA